MFGRVDGCCQLSLRAGALLGWKVWASVDTISPAWVPEVVVARCRRWFDAWKLDFFPVLWSAVSKHQSWPKSSAWPKVQVVHWIVMIVCSNFAGQQNTHCRASTCVYHTAHSCEPLFRSHRYGLIITRLAALWGWVSVELFSQKRQSHCCFFSSFACPEILGPLIGFGRFNQVQRYNYVQL